MMKDLDRYDKKMDNFAWNSKMPFKTTGQNKVFLGKDVVHDRQIIVKALPLNQFTDEYILNNLLLDWQKVQAMKSPFLCEIYSVLLSRHNLYIFEEFHVQGNLKDFIAANRHRDNYHEKALKFLNDFIKGMEFLVQNEWFHGDIKPENLLISSGVIKIDDYAFKKKMYRKNPNHLYQSHEQLVSKNKEVSIDDDVWAIGGIVYLMFAGKPAYFGLTEVDMIRSIEKDKLELPEELKDHDVVDFIKGTLQEKKKRWSMTRLTLSSLIKRLREGEKIKSKATINDLDYNAKLILMGLAQTIKTNKLDLEALFKRFDVSGDMTIELSEFQALLRVLDPKLNEMQIEHVFNMMDNDASGTITFTELKELMGLEIKKNENVFVEDKEMEAKISKMMYILRETINRNGLNINTIFSRYDSSGDMSLDITEFCSLLRDIYPSLEEGVAIYLFRKLDYDGSGDLGLNEFKSYVMEDKEMQKKLKDFEEKTQDTVSFMRNMMYGQKLDMRKLFAKADKKNRGKINEEEFRELILLIDEAIGRDIIRNIFKKIDKDGSGFIEYEEFSNYLK